jgi:hypothetical protein
MFDWGMGGVGIWKEDTVSEVIESTR